MKDMQKKLKEIEKSLTEILDSMAGDKSPAIQNALSKLADVDIEIRKALDEIEPIKQEDFEAHNKLANEANKLIEEVAAENVKGDEAENVKGDEEEDEEECECPMRHMVVHVRVVHCMPRPCLPIPWFLPF